MYEKVVVPLDGSKLAEVALPYAEEIAAKAASKIILLSVLQSEEAEEYRRYHVYADKMVNVTRRHAVKYMGNSSEKDIEIEKVSRNGHPAKAILEYVNKNARSLIVMATHGRSGISRWTVGSVADSVVRTSSRRPVMLIRANGAHPAVRAKRILKKALVPLDGSLNSEAVIPFITWLAQSLQMEINLLRVVSKNGHILAGADAYLQEKCRVFEEKGIPVRYTVKLGAPADEIIDYADDIASDVVAMSTHGQSTLRLWPLGSVAQKILLGGNTPLLLVKA